MDIILAITGLIGTLGGILISALSLKYTHDQNKPALRVKLTASNLINVPGTNSEALYLVVTISNISHIPYTVSNFGFRVGRRTGGLAIPLPLGTQTLPTVLAHDQSCTLWTPYNESLEYIINMTPRKSIKIRASISDYSERTYLSNWINVRIKDTKYSKFKAKLIKQFKADLKVVLP
jgi:hypothetical protein